MEQGKSSPLFIGRKTHKKKENWDHRTYSGVGSAISNVGAVKGRLGRM